MEKLNIALQAARAPLHGFLGGANLEAADVLSGRRRGDRKHSQ